MDTTFLIPNGIEFLLFAVPRLQKLHNPIHVLMPELTFRDITVTIKRNTCCEVILCHPIEGQKHEIMLLGMLRTFDCFHHFIFYILQAFVYIIIVRVCQILVVHIYNDIML